MAKYRLILISLYGKVFFEVTDMQIDMLAGNTVKITLGLSDMYSYNIRYEDIAGRSDDTKLALSRLIAAIKESENLDLSGERLLVEAFPKSDGGCMLYLSCLGGAKIRKQKSLSKTECILAQSECLNDIISLCHQLYKKYSSLNSSLYTLYGRYRLIISACSLSPFIRVVINEFAEVINCNDIIKSETAEHYSLICDNAIEKLSQLF